MPEDIRYGVNEHIVPLKAPVDSAGTAYASPYVNLKNVLHATFLLYFGVVTAASADQNVIVTLEASSAAASNATEVQLPFVYRLSGATGTDTWGAATAATASGGASLDTTTVDGKMLLIDLDPAIIPATHGQDDAAWVRVVVGIDAGGTVTLNSLCAILKKRYGQSSPISTS